MTVNAPTADELEHDDSMMAGLPAKFAKKCTRTAITEAVRQEITMAVPDSEINSGDSLKESTTKSESYQN